VSAYIVNYETINKIVSHLHLNRSLDWLRAEFCDVVKPANADIDGAIGAALFKMNCEAVEARYGEGEAKKFRDLHYVFRLTPSSSRQTYAAIKELQYQCAEGKVPETPLYNALVAFRAAVADEIIEQTEHQAEMESELENSLYARCAACCRGIPHDYNRCGAPVARRLLVAVGRIRGKRTA
jgi:hypothetical protein